MSNVSYRIAEPVKSIVVEAVIIRADGTHENVGAISYWHRNPLRRLWWRLTHPETP